MEILSCAHVWGKKGLNDFRFGTFIGHFPSDSVASMAEKGLIGHKVDCIILVYNICGWQEDLASQIEY